MSEQTVAEQPAVKFGFRTSTDIGEINEKRRRGIDAS